MRNRSLWVPGGVWSQLFQCGSNRLLIFRAENRQCAVFGFSSAQVLGHARVHQVLQTPPLDGGRLWPAPAAAIWSLQCCSAWI
eukprot:UN1762